MKPINILHIEDDEDDVTLVKQLLNEAGLSFTQNVISSKEELLKALQGTLPDIILSDHSLPAFNSLEALKIVKQKDIHLPFILFTGNTSEEFAVSVIKAGADDYILKGRTQKLASAILKALKKSEPNSLRIKLQEDAAQNMGESDAKYRSFFESSMDGMLLTVTDGQILAANPAACAIFQMTEEEICTAGRFGLVDLSDPKLMELIQERQRTGRAQGEITLIRKDGSKLPAEITSAVFKDGYGHERTSMIFRDITERQEIAREQVLLRHKIEKSEKKFRQIVETAQEGIWMLDENHKTIFVNKKMCEILEYGEEEMLDKPSLYFKEEEEQKIALLQIEQRKKGITETYESNFITKSGRKICTQVSTNSVMDTDGNYLGALAMVTDITEKKELQRQLVKEQINRQKQITRATLEAQEKERNNLGSELHDNINQILAAVKLQLTYCFENHDADKTILKNALENVELAMTDIRNLSHQLVTHRFGEAKFIAMVNNLVLQLFAPGMVTMNVSHFDENIAKEIKLTLYRIIQEHLKNIIKHAGAQHINLSVHSNKTEIAVTIEDDGIGFNLNQNRKGVGLTNIYNRAESYNGTVDITTEPGKGCKLKAVLPIC